MNPLARRFVELTVAPLKGTAEQRLAGEAELTRLLDEHAGRAPYALANGVEALSAAKPGRWKVALLIAACLASIGSLGFTAWQILKFAELIRGAPNGSGPLSEILSHRSQEERLLLFGNQEAADSADRWKSLWESSPDNRAYLAEHFLASYSERKPFPGELVGAATRLDPDNAWFPVLVACHQGANAVGRKRTPYLAPNAPRPTPVWIIHDRQRLEGAISSLHDATRLGRFQNYRVELMKERLNRIPQPEDFGTWFAVRSYIESQPSGNTELRKAGDLFAAAAQEYGKSGNTDAFLRMVGDWQRLSRMMLKEDLGEQDTLIAKSLTTGPLANFRDAATALGLEAEGRYFSSLHDGAQRDRMDREARRRSGSLQSDLITRRGSLMTNLSIRPFAANLASPPEITTGALRAGRYADHAVFQRVCSLPGWLALGVCAGIAVLSRNRQPPLATQLSGRLQHLFRPSDWAWVMLGGILFPLLWYLFITRCTPASAREWSLRFDLPLASVGQFGSLVLSMIVLPVVIASRRLEKRAAPLGLRPRFRWDGDLAALLALLAIPAYAGIMLPGTFGSHFKTIAFGFSSAAGVWIFAGLVRCFLARHDQAIRRATLGRLIWPAWVFGMVVFAFLIQVFHAEERHWIRQDRLNAFSADFPPTRYLHATAAQVRANTLEMLDAGEISR